MSSSLQLNELAIRFTQDPHEYIRACLDGTHNSHFVTDYELSHSEFVILFDRNGRLDIITIVSWRFTRSYDPFCLYSCFPIPPWATFFCEELQYYGSELRDVFIYALTYYSVLSFLKKEFSLVSAFPRALPPVDHVKADILRYSVFYRLLLHAEKTGMDAIMEANPGHTPPSLFYALTLNYIRHIKEEGMLSLQSGPFVDYVLPEILEMVFNWYTNNSDDEGDTL